MTVCRDVVIYSTADAQQQPLSENNQTTLNHSAAMRFHIAEKVAKLRGGRFLGYYDARCHNGAELYFIPVDTLLAAPAHDLGIQSADHLLGGVVTHPFMTTKSITHPLLDTAASAVEGWSGDFASAVATAVLDGYTAFSLHDARRAGMRLLRNNSIRIKCALGIGGGGQYLVRDHNELDTALAQLDDDEVQNYGVVLEQHLESVETFSIGQVDLAGISIVYHGTQCLTRNHRGDEVYGGSSLHIVRGNLEILRSQHLSPALSLAAAQAHCYDTAANKHLAGLIASRRNYDIAQGFDRLGLRRSGVLEQSWRSGGATPAEIAAIEVMLANPQVHTVQASTHEHYDLREPPANAIVYFQGEDAEVGALTKYCTIDSVLSA